jgi:hypothetical protein
MGAGFEAQWDATWFAERAALCLRLSHGTTQKDVIESLTAIAQDFTAQAKLADKLQSEAGKPKQP